MKRRNVIQQLRQDRDSAQFLADRSPTGSTSTFYHSGSRDAFDTAITLLTANKGKGKGSEGTEADQEPFTIWLAYNPLDHEFSAAFTQEGAEDIADEMLDDGADTVLVTSIRVKDQ